MALMASWQCLGVENESPVDKALETAWCRYNGAHGCIKLLDGQTLVLRLNVTGLKRNISIVAV